MVGSWAKAEGMERLGERMREMERTRGVNKMKTVNAIIFYFFRQACMRFS